MKKIICSVIALFSIIMALPVMAGEKPALSIREALDLAEKAKGMRENSNTVYIASIHLERTSMLNGKMIWIVKWSDNLPANNPHDREIGVQIAMDGSVKHIVKGPADTR